MRASSLVVTFCSSTAVAIVLEIPFTSLITDVLDAILSTAPLVSV